MPAARFSSCEIKSMVIWWTVSIRQLEFLSENCSTMLLRLKIRQTARPTALTSIIIAVFLALLLGINRDYHFPTLWLEKKKWDTEKGARSIPSFIIHRLQRILDLVGNCFSARWPICLLCRRIPGFLILPTELKSINLFASLVWWLLQFYSSHLSGSSAFKLPQANPVNSFEKWVNSSIEFLIYSS